MFEVVVNYINSNVEYAPFVIFGLLLLAGLNMPISEDLMIFISGILAANHPQYKWQLFLGVFGGAYVSDLMYFLIWRYFGDKLLKIKIFSRILTTKKIERIAKFYGKYGIVTLFFGRFLPFGLRNAFFMTAAISRIKSTIFYITDFLSCLFSCSVYFYLYFTFGPDVVKEIKKGNYVLLTIFLIVVFIVILSSRRASKGKIGSDIFPD